MIMFDIRMGVPEMEAFWNDLRQKIHAGTATKNETQLYKKIGKTLKQISMDPTYPGLETHDIEPLTKRYGQKVWQSYIENHTPGAGRIYWVYGPDKGEITIIGLEPHPNDSKSNAYKKITLSSTGESVQE